MLAIPGIVLLVAVIYARPQEFLGPLSAVPLLYLLFGLALFGIVLDLRLGNSRLASSPLLPWVAIFVLWSFVTLLWSVPSAASAHTRELLICLALFLLIAHGVQTFRALGAVGITVLAMALLVSAVGIQQGFASTGCVQINESIPGDQTSGKWDGRPCETARECYLGDPEPGAQYMCEHIGWFDTTSVGKGRVRYRGVLQDPNELALAGAIGLPLAFAIGRRRRHPISRTLLVLLSFAAILVCTVLTRSRGGQLVFLTVLAAYFLKRFGWKGLVAGGTLALPLLVLGGRGGEEASSSTLERADCWIEALSLSRENPIFGVGFGQFGQYHYLTAHNSYMLSLAELGLPGMFFFTMLVYLAVKIPLQAVRQGAGSAQPWAMALLAALAGLAVGMFFLSFSYHYVLWIYLGLAGALYAAMRTHDPGFHVRVGFKDLVYVGAIDVGIIGLVWLYTKLAFL